ncbi:hypothetical protein [Mesorhizobium sp. B2-6-1]|uniref:hypothetical protein n=1 Tax=Mesorhizobium sp. B2-6-1 TaxID=2589916 RepID=UPI0011267AB5|nr:hypothetical protein [Mesorhizobium sp. B2-6-1]TPJ60824.1 hypothetical protein FJ443_19990 [Mesorhizobium sp. B2-6-1]
MNNVLKPFNSTSRRYAVGDPVRETDDLSPHSFEDLKARKFIGTPKPAQAEKAAAPSSKDK